jgi:hypothetical protein
VLPTLGRAQRADKNDKNLGTKRAARFILPSPSSVGWPLLFPCHFQTYETVRQRATKCDCDHRRYAELQNSTCGVRHGSHHRPAAQAASPVQPMTFRSSPMDVAAIANFRKWALERDDFSSKSSSRSFFLFEHDLFGKPVPTLPDHALVASQRLKLSPAVAFFPADGRLGHFTHAHWSLLQTLDKPPARGPGRRLRLPHHRHR